MIVRILWRRRKPAFVYPTRLQPPPRTAVLVPYFSSCGAIRVFQGGWSEEVEKFAPEAVAGTFGQLETLAQTGVKSLCHAVIVVERWGDPLLTESRREQLWNAFRVPVYEQMIGEDGELLASDCEAHEGLHIESPRLRVGKEFVNASLCACGRKTPRLVPAEHAGSVRRVAAFASG